MLKKNYYTTLGLSPTCAHQDIKKNYHKLALLWHPDKHSNKIEAETKFTEIHEAYTILADAKKRRIYDTSGHRGLELEQELNDFTNDNQSNIFFQKGFNGTNKSAFDLLRDIFEENEDDEEDFFDECNIFDIPDNFKDNIKSFIQENIMDSESEDEEDFFANYTPSFMDTNFFCTPPSLFQSLVPENDCSSDFFSFFSSLETDMHTFTQNSKTVKKVRTSKKQKVQRGNKVYEDEEIHEYVETGSARFSSDKNAGPRPCKKMRCDKQTAKNVIIEEEDFEEFFGLNNNNKKKGSGKKKNKGKKDIEVEVNWENVTYVNNHDNINEKPEAKYSQKNIKKSKNKM